ARQGGATVSGERRPVRRIAAPLSADAYGVSEMGRRGRRADPRVRRPDPGLLSPFRSRRSEAVRKRLVVVMFMVASGSSSVPPVAGQEAGEGGPGGGGGAEDAGAPPDGGAEV